MDSSSSSSHTATHDQSSTLWVFISAYGYYPKKFFKIRLFPCGGEAKGIRANLGDCLQTVTYFCIVYLSNRSESCLRSKTSGLTRHIQNILSGRFTRCDLVVQGHNALLGKRKSLIDCDTDFTIGNPLGDLILNSSVLAQAHSRSP